MECTIFVENYCWKFEAWPIESCLPPSDGDTNHAQKRFYLKGREDVLDFKATCINKNNDPHTVNKAFRINSAILHECDFKGTLHPKIKLLSSFAHL